MFSSGETEHCLLPARDRRLYGRHWAQDWRGQGEQLSARQQDNQLPPQVVGSGGGVLAGGLTLAGGVMTVLTAGAALPVLVAVGSVLSLGLKQLSVIREPLLVWPAGWLAGPPPSPRKSSTPSR